MARGTEIRQRKIVLTARFNDTEAAAIRNKASKTGQSVGAVHCHGHPHPFRYG